MNTSVRQHIISYVSTFPRNRIFTAPEVSKEMSLENKHVSAVIGEMHRDEGMLEFIGEYPGLRGKPRKAYRLKTNEAIDVSSPDRSQFLSLLSIYTTAELVEELKRRSS